ncbi:MAG: ABC transporter ATP-binding protein [Lachnospiraceae bacterium]|nr:ABC transporter ATP-binding protein [Lachnospiraceae bacterium]
MIEVEHLVKKYGDHFAVEDISFSAEPGRIYGFLGPNGAGKSTTMNIMTGYLAATSGTVRINDFDIVRQPEEAKKRIGYLPEVPPVYGDMTVREYLMFAAELKKMPKNTWKEAVAASMEKTAVTHMQERLIRNLSKGYRQRVGLAQAIINDPDIIILDEPTAGLDPAQQREMFDYIRSLKGEHTIILSSHILSDVSEICDYVWILNKGRLVASDTPENLGKRLTSDHEIDLRVNGTEAEVRKVLEGFAGIDIRDTVASEDGTVLMHLAEPAGQDNRAALSVALINASLPILTLTRPQRTLEEVFFTLTAEDADEAAAALEAENENEGGQE